MHKSDHTLLIWVLSWAVVLLALLYSPLGSPELYKNKKYFNENQGVDFNKIIILNTPNNDNSSNNVEELNIPVQNRTKKNYNYSVDAVSSHRSASFNTQSSVRPYNHKRNSTYSTNAGSAGGGVSSATISGNRNTNNSSSNQLNAGGLTQLGGLLAMNETNSALTTDSTAVQDPQNDSTQPLQKADEPNIPVGEGRLLLLLMAGIYIYFKSRKIKNENC